MGDKKKAQFENDELDSLDDLDDDVDFEESPEESPEEPVEDLPLRPVISGNEYRPFRLNRWFQAALAGAIHYRWR